MSNCVKIIVGTMAKGKDIMLKIAVIDDEEYYSELIRQTVCNWLMEKGCQGEIDCFDHADDFKTQIENGRCMIFILWISRCRISAAWNWPPMFV